MTLLPPLASSYIKLAEQAITEDNFAGEDCRYRAEFERLEDACHNSQALHHDVTPDWADIAEQAAVFLREQSKDLRVVGWLTWALQRTQGWAGLQAGLALLERLIEGRWEVLHPRKERTRAAAANWLCSRLDGLFDSATLNTLEPSWLQIFSAQLARLESLLQPRLGDAAPLLLPLVRRLDEQQRRQAQPSAASLSTHAAGAADTTATSIVQPLPPGPVESDRDAHRQLRQLQEGARSLSAWWLRQRSGDPRALRLNRALLWSGIDSLPAHDAQGITGLRGLPADRLKFFQERQAAGDAATLLGELETSLARAPFWLDGQRLAWECLQTLGAEAACRELEWPLLLLLERLPGLEALAFHDGQPFADAQTRLWLAGLATRSTPQAAVASDGDTPREDWRAALAEALEELRGSGLKSAVRLLQAGRLGAQGERQRLLWDLASAQLLIHARQFELAHFQLADLDGEHGPLLARWEPQLALHILQARRQCLEALPVTADSRAQLQQLRPRLCRLDLEAALD
ncbi:MAG: type VI secretion system protein TssA [Pseudomonas oryzihabitans]